MASGVPLGDMVLRLLLDSSQFTRAFEQSIHSLNDFNRQLIHMGRALTAAVTAPLLGLAGASVKAFASFESAMVRSTSIMGDVSEDMKRRLEENAKTMSLTTTSSATKLANTYHELAAAGLSAEQSLGALGVVEKFSRAASIDLSFATRYLVDSQNALGLSSKNAVTNMQNMKRVSDVLIKAGIMTSSSVEQLAKALSGKAAGAARMLGKDIEEVMAVLSAFSDQGVKARTSGEQINRAWNDMQKAVLDNYPAWKKLGLEVYDSSGEMKKTADVIEIMEKRFAGMSDAQREAAAGALGFNRIGFNAIRQLLGTSARIREYEKALRGAGDTTQRVADRQLKSFSAQMTMLWNNITLVGMEIGESLIPSLNNLAEEVRGLLRWWKGLNDQQKQTLGQWVAMAAALGPLVVILSMVARVVGVLTAVVQGLLTVLLVVIPVVARFVGAWAVERTGLFALAIAVVTDALLQMFGVGNLGVNDWILSFRFGGTQIKTILQAVTLDISQDFADMFHEVEMGWEYLVSSVQDLAGSMYRGLLKSARMSSYVFWSIFDPGGMFGLDMTAWDYYTEKIDESLGAVEGRHEEYYKTLAGMEKEHRKGVEETDRLIMALRINDTAERDNVLTAEQEDFTERMRQLGLTSGQQEFLDKTRALVSGLTSTALGGAAEGGSSGAFPDFGSGSGKFKDPASFQEVSLRRFALDGPGGLARPADQQEVRAKGVEKRLDAIRQIMENKNNQTVLQ